MGWRDALWLALVAVNLAAASIISRAGAEDHAAVLACGGAALARGTVDRIIDGRSFVLSHGREVRLGAIEVPPLPSEAATGSAGAAAKAALDALAGGETVVLRGDDTATDRYGRLVGYAYTQRDGDELFVQGGLIGSGFALVGDRVDGRMCAAALLGRERAARDGKLGLWSNADFAVLDAAAVADIRAHRGRFALVAGTVVSVHESGPMLYVNFGAHWSEDFAATIRKRNERNFAAAGIDLRTLAGRRVLVRGFVQTRGDDDTGSPFIAVERPEQIELAAPP